MKPTTLSCCRFMKPLDEKQRDSLLAKILNIGNCGNKTDRKVIDAANELKMLKKEGFDVDSYFLVFLGFMEKNSQGA